MHYFFPAWYENAWSWHSPRTPWYFAGQKIEFDETIHQVRIFHSQEQPVTLLLLGYNPQLRYQLHRHDLLETPHVALFDDLQGISDVSPRTLQVEEFEWDEWCEFVYTPFIISVFRHGQHYAQIEFTQEGLISHLNFFENGQIVRTQIYDDRGFLSSVEVYEHGQKVMQEYLNEAGEWQFREYVDGRQPAIVVNPALEMKFMKLSYDTMTELVQERLRLLLALSLKEGDQVILPGHPHHETTVLPLVPEMIPVIGTTFIERQSKEDFASQRSLIDRCVAVIVDRRDTTRYLEENIPTERGKFYYMPSFDTRLRLGISQQKKYEQLYFHINPEDFNLEMIKPVLRFVKENPFTKLIVGTVNAGIGEYQEKIEEWLESQAIDLEDIEEEASDHENQLPGEEEWQSRMTFQQYMNELDLIQALEPTRLVLDFSQTPNVYVQIASISAGIPQLNCVETEYVTHLENGYILTSPEQFEEAAHYYLDQLKYWNEALIHAIDKIRDNTGSAFLEKWQNATESR